jgi:hypothetical protein
MIRGPARRRSSSVPLKSAGGPVPQDRRWHPCRPRKAGNCPGLGARRYACVAEGDVVEAIIRAALDPVTPTETFALAARRPSSSTSSCDASTARGSAFRHVADRAARLPARVVPSLSRPLVDVLPRGCLPQQIHARPRCDCSSLSTSWARCGRSSSDRLSHPGRTRVKVGLAHEPSPAVPSDRYAA